jgi:hypothetical protein
LTLISDGLGNAKNAPGSCIVWFDSAGSRKVTAKYHDGTYAPSSYSANITVKQDNPLVSILAVTPGPVTPSNSWVYVTVQVIGNPGAVIPTGYVGISVNNGETATCSIQLPGVFPNLDTCRVNLSNLGLSTITAQYYGDGNYFSGSKDVPHTVN